MNEQDFERLKTNITKLCKMHGVDEQFIDFDHEVDKTLTFEEQYNILKEAYNLKDKDDLKKYEKSINEQYTYEKWNDIKQDGLSLFDDVRPYCVCILGERDSGKTTQGHQVCDRLRKAHHLPVYVYKYPRLDLLNKIGYKNLKELRSVEQMGNFILWLDEPQITIPKYDGRNNDILEKLLSICRHKGIILVISTSDTRWVNRELESYVDVWIVKDIDFEMVKQGSRAKYIIKQNAVLDPQAFKLDKNEYLLYYRKDEQYQGKFKISLPLYWSDEYSKPYEIPNKTTTKTKTETTRKN